MPHLAVPSLGTRAITRGLWVRAATCALGLALVATGGLPASAGIPAGTRDARDVPMIDQIGKTFTFRDLARPTAVVFIDTECDDACTIAEGLFARLAQTLKAQHVDARLVTITMDPDHESPFVMANAARKWSVDARQWHWASGKPRDVKDLMQAFHVVRVDKNVHSTFAYVLDAHGIPTRTVPLSTVADTQLLAALRDASRGR